MMPSEADLALVQADVYRENIIQDPHASFKTARLRLNAGRLDSIASSDDQPCVCPEQKVGILGAGIAGLYAALILDSLDIEYEILEASDRTGGRISTHQFPGGDNYDYYDMGPMRFPLPTRDSQGQYHDGVMKRLAELTEYEPLNEGQNRLRDSIIPFYYRARDNARPGFYYFNGIREPISDVPKGAFGAQEMGVGTDYIRAGADAIISDATEPFFRMLAQDLETGKGDGWESLLAYDSYTLHTYMATKYLPSPRLGLPAQHLPNNVINWCGLLGGGVSDRALVTVALSWLAFAEGNADLQWKCFEGGTETLTKKIEEYLNKKGSFIRLNKRVSAISQIQTGSPDDRLPVGAEELLDDFIDLALDNDKTIDGSIGPGEGIETSPVTVTVNGHEKHNYSHVISTLPLPVLRAVDLNDAGLSIMQKNALRSLTYVASTKVAILFKSNWWTTKLGIVGGETATDLPIGSVIYPSHGVDSDTPSKVLIAGFCWNADADHVGSLATPEHREVLKDLVLRNLAEVHSGLHPDITYEYLEEEFVEMHVKDWNRDAYAMGAFAALGPGQFQNLHTSLTFPAAGKRLHFAGEAVSLRHGWIVGALDSSWSAVHAYLKVTGQDEKMNKFKALWGENSEWTSSKSPPAADAAKEKQVPAAQGTSGWLTALLAKVSSLGSR